MADKLASVTAATSFSNERNGSTGLKLASVTAATSFTMLRPA